jgi:hypothetical protein
MTRLKYLLLVLALCMILLPIGRARGIPSSGFTTKNGEWYDSFGIDRNQYDGSHGYLPNMAYETLNANRELAYSIGAWFQDNYPSTTARAKAILQYVQTWTEYGYDSDNVVKDGVSQDEWAWNADEMAHKFNETTGVKAVGDCEDMAFLCATIYTGAGIDAAIVDAPGHVACLIWLPEFSNADNYLDLPNDNRGSGWIWVEATGSTNPLGWTPQDYTDGNWNAYPISATGSIDATFTPQPPNIPTEPEQFPTDLIILGAIALIILLAIVVAAGSKKRKQDTNLPPQPPLPPPPPDWNGQTSTPAPALCLQ